MELLNTRVDLSLFENFCNSHNFVLTSVAQLNANKTTLFQGCIRDNTVLVAAFLVSYALAVVRFAEFKSVGESVQMPLSNKYNNLTCSLHLLQIISQGDVKMLVLSASVTGFGICNAC